jgi:hypothetical protein
VSELLSGPVTRTRHALFAHQARAALEKHVPEARTGTAHWNMGANVAWVRIRRADGLHAYFALRRHLDWVSGEAGVSRDPLDLNDLSPLPGHIDPGARGHRIRLGELLDGRDRWWPSGESAAELDQRLGYLALQLAVRGGAYFRRWPRSER